MKLVLRISTVLAWYFKKKLLLIFINTCVHHVILLSVAHLPWRVVAKITGQVNNDLLHNTELNANISRTEQEMKVSGELTNAPAGSGTFAYRSFVQNLMYRAYCWS